MTILSNGHLWKYSKFIENKQYSFNKNKILDSLSKKDIDEAYLKLKSMCDASDILRNKYA